MDIRAGIIATAVLLVLGALLVARGGLRTLQAARKLTFYRLRQSRISSAWRLFGAALLLVLISIWLPIYGQPIAYHYFPPSPTVAPTLTPSVVPTITLSPTITLTPTITDTPLFSETPTGTAIPSIPLVVDAQFSSIVTPNPDTSIGLMQFSTAIDRNGFCVTPSDLFRNPISHMYACFTYDKMLIGSQWTALWYRNGEYVDSETYPWNLSTGGIAYSDLVQPPDGWQPGVYTVQIFVGHVFKQAGSFTVEGLAPTVAATRSPTPAPAATP